MIAVAVSIAAYRRCLHATSLLAPHFQINTSGMQSVSCHLVGRCLRIPRRRRARHGRLLRLHPKRRRIPRRFHLLEMRR